MGVYDSEIKRDLELAINMLSDVESASVDSSNPEILKKEFEQYIRYCVPTSRRSGTDIHYTESAISSFLSYLNPDVIFGTITRLKDSIGWINSISSPSKMDDICKRLLEDAEFKSYDETKSQWGTKTLMLYDSFLHARELFAKKTISESPKIKKEPKYDFSSLPEPPLSYTQFITAIKTKPFVLLAGISGTGKSRIVRQLARACDTIDENPWTVQKPANFEMIQVRPDWHDGSEMLGYESRISGKGEYVVKEFVKFVVKAWIYEHEDVPFFLCLDEMNLAPVEQYFAEYLSVVETRKADKDGNITCDPLIKLNKEYCQSIANAIYPGSEGDAHDEEQLSNVENLMALLEGMDYCIPLPKNLIVMGTVNMDETTFGFSRKVLDRAMTIEMNEVDLAGGLEDTDKERFGIAAADILPTAVEGKDVYAENKELCDKVIGYLQQVNDVLEDTPFKIAYRTRNEFLVYAVNRGEDNLTESLDEMTSMKILSRIEGDQDKVGHVLEGLEQVMKDNGLAEESLSLKKVKSMTQRLKSGYTSYWN